MKQLKWYRTALGSAMLVSCLGAATPALAEQIQLIDGSVIQGEVMSMRDGAYQVKTPSLGIINLPKSQVRAITAGAAAPSTPAPADSAQSSAIESLQARMVQDKGMMSSIMSLQNHPDMQAVLSDPEVMRAVQSFDLQTLANHPKIKKLMQNREIQQIQGKVN